MYDERTVGELTALSWAWKQGQDAYGTGLANPYELAIKSRETINKLVSLISESSAKCSTELAEYLFDNGVTVE